MATIDKDLLLDKIDRLLKLHNYAREDWFANVIHNTVWDAPEIETDGETIYRADAIETVRNVSRDLIQDKCMPLGCATDFTDALSALPSAETVCEETQTERTGRWYIIEYEFFTCDQCGEDVPSYAESTSEAKEMLNNGDCPNYCPNCGAKMSKGGDDE